MQLRGEDACRLACEYLADALPHRWLHVQGVAAAAADVAPRVVRGAERLVVAAWLHDIGYAPPLVDSGLHPLDGARFLRRGGIGDRGLWSLVANHTGAVMEASMRGFEAALSSEFPAFDATVDEHAVLTYCDLVTTPEGERTSPEQRIAEILERYPPDDVVHRAVSASAVGLLETAHAVATRLAGD